MGPPIASAKLTLSYPLYAADFDPSNSDYLIVGGGGGEGRSGIGNKIVHIRDILIHIITTDTLVQTLIDTSRKNGIKELVDIDLSKGEDSVMSLAVAHTSDVSATVLAGINSSSAEQQVGRNDHLRSFKLGYPPNRKRGAASTGASADGEAEKPVVETKALGKASLFIPSSEQKKETYQRVLRLSTPRKDNGFLLGVMATGLAPEGEVVVFDATHPSPNVSDVRARIPLGKGVEAGDVDLIDSKDGKYRIAYCTDYEVYLYQLPLDTKVKAPEPRLLHGTPHPDVFASSSIRPKFRSLRFLTPNLILLLRNEINRSGAELFLLDVSNGGLTLGTILLHKRLHRGIKSASALAVTLLPAAAERLSASLKQNNMQHVIAVAGHDNSVTVLSLDHPLARLPSTPLKFRTHCTLRNVHPLQITSLAFSTFNPPMDPSTAPAQYLKLASVSISNTVIVHTFSLRMYPPPTSHKRTPIRYVLQSPGASEAAQISWSVLVSIVVVALGAFLLQAWTEIRGGTPEYLGAKGWLSQSVHDYIARPYMFENYSMELPVITSNLPKVENVKDRVASLNEEAKDEVPSVEEVKEKLIENLEAINEALPAGQEIKDQIVEGVESAKDNIPSAADVTDSVKKGVRSIASALPSGHLRSFLKHRHKSPGKAVIPPDNHLIVLDTGTSLSAESHHDAEHVAKHGKKWEELAHHERESWKKKLSEAGEWAAEQGEGVLKGIFFGEIGGIVGGAIGNAIG